MQKGLFCMTNVLKHYRAFEIPAVLRAWTARVLGVRRSCGLAVGRSHMWMCTNGMFLAMLLCARSLLMACVGIHGTDR